MLQVIDAGTNARFVLTSLSRFNFLKNIEKNLEEGIGPHLVPNSQDRGASDISHG